MELIQFSIDNICTNCYDIIRKTTKEKTTKDVKAFPVVTYVTKTIDAPYTFVSDNTIKIQAKGLIDNSNVDALTDTFRPHFVLLNDKQYYVTDFKINLGGVCTITAVMDLFYNANFLQDFPIKLEQIKYNEGIEDYISKEGALQLLQPQNIKGSGTFVDNNQNTGDKPVLVIWHTNGTMHGDSTQRLDSNYNYINDDGVVKMNEVYGGGLFCYIVPLVSQVVRTSNGQNCLTGLPSNLVEGVGGSNVVCSYICMASTIKVNATTYLDQYLRDSNPETFFNDDTNFLYASRAKSGTYTAFLAFTMGASVVKTYSMPVPQEINPLYTTTTVVGGMNQVGLRFIKKRPANTNIVQKTLHTPQGLLYSFTDDLTEENFENITIVNNNFIVTGSSVSQSDISLQQHRLMQNALMSISGSVLGVGESAKGGKAADVYQASMGGLTSIGKTIIDVNRQKQDMERQQLQRQVISQIGDITSFIQDNPQYQPRLLLKTLSPQQRAIVDAINQYEGLPCDAVIFLNKLKEYGDNYGPTPVKGDLMATTSGFELKEVLDVARDRLNKGIVVYVR